MKIWTDSNYDFNSKPNTNKEEMSKAKQLFLVTRKNKHSPHWIGNFAKTYLERKNSHSSLEEKIFTNAHTAESIRKLN